MKEYNVEVKKIPQLRFSEFDGEFAEQRIGKSIDQLVGFAFKGEDISEDTSGIPLLRGVNITEGEIRHNQEIDRYYSGPTTKLTNYFVNQGDLVIGMDGSKVGRNSSLITKNDEGSLLVQRVARIKAKEAISIPYIYHHINSFRFYNYVEKVKTSSGIPHISSKQINDFKIFLPSLPEQQKIASFLSEVDKKTQQLSRKRELLEQYKKGVMQKIFSQEIRFKDKNGEDYADWEEKRLGDVGTTYNGLNGKSADDFGEGAPFVTYKQIFDNSKIDTRKFNYVRINPGEKQNEVKFGDVFFTTSSETRMEVGFASVILDEIEQVYLNSFCFGFRINSHAEFLPEFARYLFRSDVFRKKITKLGQGSTRYNMSKNEMKKLKIQLPCNREQKLISVFLSNIDTKIERVRIQLEQIQQFKRGLLQQMFV